MTVSDYFFVILAFDEVRDLRKLIRSYNCKFKCVKRHFISHELLQLGSKFYLVFLAQLLNFNNAMKIFLRVLNASVHKTLNFLPLCILLTEKKLVGPWEIFVEIFVYRNNPNEMQLCL